MQFLLPLLAALWISDGKPVLDGVAAYGDDPAPVMRKVFSAPRVVDARLAVASLGYYDIEINGRRVTPSSLMPYWTVVDRTIHEDTYPVAEFLRPGENEIRVTLGNGWYNPLPIKMFCRWCLRDYLGCGRPQIRLSVTSGIRTLVETDGTWEFAETGILRNNVYLGTTVDARVKPTDWKPVAVAAEPKGEIVPNPAPAITPHDRVYGVPRPLVTPPWYRFGAPTRQIVDFGRNGSGVPTFYLGRCKRGQKLVFRYGELLHPDGTLNPMTSVYSQIKWGGAGEGAPEIAEAVDTYVCSGEGEERFTPPFTYHAFRYAEVIGLGHALPGKWTTAEIHCSDVANALEFSCSRGDFNTLHEVCRRTFLSNLVGVQSDCPGRERLGYGGDIVATAEAFALNFDMDGFYLKSIRDFVDESVRQGGWFTETAPFVGIGDPTYAEAAKGGTMAWVFAAPAMADVLLRHYGDMRVLDFYEAFAGYLRKVDAKFPDGIVPASVGDHEGVEQGDNTVFSTICYGLFARIAAKMARLKHLDAEAAEFDALATAVVAAFRDRFVKNGRVDKGVQGEQAFALLYGFVPASQVAAADRILLDDIDAHGGALTTGILGTRALLAYLTRTGRADVAARVVSNPRAPGWLYMLENGATTLWESWNAGDNFPSHDHPMFGSVDEWLVNAVLGVTVPDDANGSDRVVVDPKPVAGVTWARGSLVLPQGRLSVSWRLDAQGKVLCDVSAPEGVTVVRRHPNGRK